MVYNFLNPWGVLDPRLSPLPPPCRIEHVRVSIGRYCCIAGLVVAF
jgi:hypothetical protein